MKNLKTTMAAPVEVSIAAARASVILELVSIFHCKQSKKEGFPHWKISFRSSPDFDSSTGSAALSEWLKLAHYIPRYAFSRCFFVTDPDLACLLHPA